MSLSILWLALIVFLPVVVFYLLQVNAAPVFLSLCLGYVLVAFDSKNSRSFLGSINQTSAPIHIKASVIAINLVLLLGPAVLTILSQIKTINGSRKLLNLLSSLSVGLFAALITVPRLPVSISGKIASNQYWLYIIKYQTYIVGIGSLIALVFFLITIHKKESKKHH